MPIIYGVGPPIRKSLARVYTSLAVVDIENQRFVLREKLPGMSVAELQGLTGAPLVLPDHIGALVVPEL